MNLMLMRQIDEQFLEPPFFGVRQMIWHLRKFEGGVAQVGPRTPRPRSSGERETHPAADADLPKTHHLPSGRICAARVRGGKAAKGQKISPYLLRGLRLDHPNQISCADITQLPMRKGFPYLVAIMD